MIKKLYYVLRVIPKLGYWNVAYMVWYRLSMKTGIRKLFFATGEPIEGPFFKSCEIDSNYPEEWKPALKKQADQIVDGKLTWFHYHKHDVGNPPDWFLNPFSGERITNPNKHWTELGDFDMNIGDIKIIWEPSRFDWVTDLARAYRVFGDEKYLNTLNHWLEDWSQKNPLNIGPNWKCGQETSIRIFKLFTTSTILQQTDEITPALNELIWHHLQRVKPNIRYAIAQDNNHGTSESAVLYVGSVWLLGQKKLDRNKKLKLSKWKTLGRNILEERINTLVEKDGTFAQKSVTYHRVVVDTMSIVLHAQKLFEESPFKEEFVQRSNKLGEWQVKMTIPENGDAPNIGSNDGAMFENMHECGYRDFRPSSQLFFGLLKNQKIYEDGEWNEPLYWRSKNHQEVLALKPFQFSESELLDHQFLIIRKGALQCFLKVLDDGFRPDLDLFHLDVWYKGENLLLDSGSYSYNAGKETAIFKSIKAHNTVQFSDFEPMPKLSRFLNGEWIKPTELTEPYEEGDITKWEGAYTDYLGNHHKRSLQVSATLVKIVDEVETDEQSVLRFHISKQVQKEEDNIYSFLNGTITFDGVMNSRMKSAEHSLFYMEKKSHRVLETNFNEKKIITEIKLDTV